MKKKTAYAKRCGKTVKKRNPSKCSVCRDAHHDMRTCSHPEPGKRREVATAVAAKTREIRTSELFNKCEITYEEKALPEAEVHPRRVCKEVARNAYYLLASEDSLLSGTLSLWFHGKHGNPCRAESVLHPQQLKIVRAI